MVPRSGRYVNLSVVLALCVPLIDSLQAEPAYAIPQANGRLQLILRTRAPLILVVPNKHAKTALNVALRLAHDLHAFHKLDSEIWTNDEAIQNMESGGLKDTNMVVIGPMNMTLVHRLVAREKSAFKSDGTYLNLHGSTLSKPSTGACFFSL